MEDPLVAPVNNLRVHFKEEDGSVLFESYVPPSRDAVHMPTYVLYLIIAMFTVLSVLYAIIGHLIKDLLHDCADWLFGAQPEEVEVNYCEAKDKFIADWTPETSPELEAMARAEEKNSFDKDFLRAPAVWIISEVVDARSNRGPARVVFGKKT
ncbi:unnamed protein product [Knipowitschia caucasica]